MVEVPSVIFQLDDILQRADFVSVGTNDLAQFIFACDRGNPKLSERYDVLSAPFLNVMKRSSTRRMQPVFTVPSAAKWRVIRSKRWR